MSYKIGENIAVTTVFVSNQLNSATVYYNGQSITTTSIMVDTQGFDSYEVHLNPGTFAGPTATLSNAIYVSQTNDPTTASALSGASFTDITQSSGASAEQIGFVKCKDTERYHCLRTDFGAATAATTNFGATMILGQADSVPTGDEARTVFNI